MFIEALMVFKSYVPLQLEKGMYFIVQHPRFKEIAKLERVPLNQEEYIKLNGYPVEPYVIMPPPLNHDTPYVETILAQPEQIGWFDEGEWTDELCDIETKHINRIIEGYDGYVLIEMMDDPDDPENSMVPVLYDNKVTLMFADLEDEYDDNDDDDYEDDVHTENDFD